MPGNVMEDPIQLLLVRLESKVDTVLARHELRLEQHDSNHADHENRLRSLEQSLHALATKSDIEEIESKRSTEQTNRQRRTMAWLGIALALLVPIESAIVALIIQSIQS